MGILTSSFFSKAFFNRFKRVTSSGNFIAEIDGFRFYAIMTVLLLHMNTNFKRVFPFGIAHYNKSGLDKFLTLQGIGVDFFFIISGFILTLPLVNSFEKFSYKKFLIRRITRLEPPFVICILVLFCLQIAVGYLPFRDNVPHLLATLTYSHFLIYGVWSPINPVTWSLETEFQFYLVAPLLAWLYFQKSGNYAVAAAIVSILLLYFLDVLFNDQIAALHLSHSIVIYGGYFLSGILLAYLYKKKPGMFALSGRWNYLIPFPFLLIYCFHSEVYNVPLLQLCGLILLFISGFRAPILNKFFKNQFISSIGGMCYSIYLLHYSMIYILFALFAKFMVISSYGMMFLLFSFTLVIIIVAVAMFYLLFEKPFMKPGWYKLKSQPKT